MPICVICGRDKKRGYRINPRTGRQEPGRFWCEADFESVVMRTTREKTDPTPPTTIAGPARDHKQYKRKKPAE